MTLLYRDLIGCLLVLNFRTHVTTNQKPYIDPCKAASSVWIFWGSNLRPRLQKPGQMFTRTNFVPGPPVYMDLCKFCYRLQWCLHGSMQILRPVIFALLFHLIAK